MAVGVKDHLSDLLRAGLFDWIVPDQIAAMAMPELEDLGKLRAAGVTLLVSVVPSPFCPAAARQAGLRQLHLPVEYWCAPHEQQVQQFIAAVRAELQRGGKVVVHCVGGIGRTGTVIACYLVSEGMEPDEAIAFVRHRRPGSIESIEQEAAVFAWAAAEARESAASSPGPVHGAGAPQRKDAGASESETIEAQQPGMVLPEERQSSMAKALLKGYLNWGSNGSDVHIRALPADSGDAPSVEELKSALRSFRAEDGVTVTLTEVLGKDGEAWITVSCARGRQGGLLMAAGEIVDLLVRQSVYGEVLLSNP